MSARAVPGLKAGVTIAQAQRLTAESFRTAAIDSPDADARALIGAALRLSRAKLIAQSDRILEPRETKAIGALAARRLKREPVARILGQKEFWSLPLSLTPDVLVPSDREIPRSVNEGTPIVAARERSDAAKAFRELADRYARTPVRSSVSAPVEEESGMKALLGRRRR